MRRRPGGGMSDDASWRSVRSVAALVGRAVDRDPDAWESLYRRSYRRLFGFARRRLFDEQAGRGRRERDDDPSAGQHRPLQLAGRRLRRLALRDRPQRRARVRPVSPADRRPGRPERRRPSGARRSTLSSASDEKAAMRHGVRPAEPRGARDARAARARRPQLGGGRTAARQASRGGPHGAGPGAPAAARRSWRRCAVPTDDELSELLARALDDGPAAPPPERIAALRARAETARRPWATVRAGGIPPRPPARRCGLGAGGGLRRRERVRRGDDELPVTWSSTAR